MERESFVMHREYIDDLPDENKAEFLMYCYDYALNGKEPSLDGLKNTVWIKIKRRIDSDYESYAMRVERTRKQRSEAGKSHKGNQYSKQDANAIEENASENWNEMERNGTTVPFVPNEWNEMEQMGRMEHEFDNEFDNDSDSEFVNDPGRGCEFDAEHAPPSAPSASAIFSKTLFGIFKDAGLPCNNDEISFLQKDFRNGMSEIHKRADMKGVHSDEITAACRNYAALSKNPLLFEGYSNHLGFYRLSQKKWLYDLLPSNFDEKSFLVRTANPASETPENRADTILQDMADNPDFIPSILESFRDDWEENGKPTGEAYLVWQREKELSGLGKKLKGEWLSQKGA